MPAMPRSPTPPPKSVTDFASSKVAKRKFGEIDDDDDDDESLSHCPDGAQCDDPNCFMMHLCTGSNCGCRGKRWRTCDQFKYNNQKRFKTCIAMREHSKTNCNADAQKRAYDDNMARIAKMSKDEKPITPQAADAKAEEISQKALDALRGMSIEEVAEEGKTVLYVGYTGRLVQQEHLSWLTVRTNGRAAPILTWPDGTTIEAGQATDKLGFDSVELYSSTLKINARAVEAALQRRFDYLRLGVRLWRENDKGAKYDKPKDKGKVHKVFLTFSRKARKAIRKGKIVVNS